MHNPRAVLKQYQASMMKLSAVLFSQKHSIKDIWQGCKYGSTASFFNSFPLSLYMNILLFFCKCAATLLMWRKLYDISLVPKLFSLYWLWKYQIFILSSLWKTSRWNARLIYTINKNNNKSKNKTRPVFESFWKVSSKQNNFIYYITKIFPLYTLNDVASFNFFKFCCFKQSISTWKFKAYAFLLLLSTASKFVKKLHGNLRY